jgi:CRP/FNR family transcriptional regulator
MAFAEVVSMMNRPLSDKKAPEVSQPEGLREQQIPTFSPVAAGHGQTKTHFSEFLAIKPGEKLMEQWKKSEHVYLIREGLVKLVHGSENGSQVTLGLRSAGWYAGVAQAILDVPNLYTVIAVDACKVTQIPSADFFGWTTRNVKKLHQVMKSLSLDSIMQAKLHAEINSSSAAERLEHFMQERTVRDSQWKTVDPLPLLKQGELAELLAVSPEHLCRLRAQRTQDR